MHPSAGKQLYESYHAYKIKKPLPAEDIKKDKKQLLIGIKQCLKAAQFELTISKQSSILKSALWGKPSLENYQLSPDEDEENLDTSECYMVCKYLRVAVQLRNELHKRTITYE
jgi:hypothetical protein